MFCSVSEDPRHSSCLRRIASCHALCVCDRLWCGSLSGLTLLGVTVSASRCNVALSKVGGLLFYQIFILLKWLLHKNHVKSLSPHPILLFLTQRPATSKSWHVRNNWQLHCHDDNGGYGWWLGESGRNLRSELLIHRFCLKYDI